MVALPQARKASLARFLEKRKERVTSASPYCSDKKSPTDCRTPISECIREYKTGSTGTYPTGSTDTILSRHIEALCPTPPANRHRTIDHKQLN
ncbi:hypothetical protein F2Q68_00017443 [Brassica cretica]|uniref:Uncharacterized protein n=1 Tax=Brassica cretica TaxID=69181 RepID=A0A8S9HN94_BRACR|nr:hypothetical protein F2Q68_00017443 [Brassica cretica]